MWANICLGVKRRVASFGKPACHMAEGDASHRSCLLYLSWQKRALHYISGSISFPKMPQLLADNNTDDSFTVSASYTVRVIADKEKHFYIYKHTQLVLLPVWSNWHKIKLYRFYFTVQTLSNVYLNTLNSFTLWLTLNCYFNLMNKNITTGRIRKGL